MLTTAAVVSIPRADMDGAAKVGWSAISVLVPVVGPAVWFFAHRRRRRAM
ncbi:hypothetical protein ABH922_002947 [Rhodococcus sp. 27YEA15]